MTDTRLSICIPTYNFGKFIGETLDSILQQLEDGVEVVIVDGASQDNTEEVVASYIKKCPSIKYHRQEKRGGIDHDMALSIKLAKGEYCWLFSSDDIMRKGAISKIMNEIQKGLDVYICGSTLCELEINNIIKEHPVFNISKDTEFDLDIDEDRALFFEKASSTAAFFSFMSSVIIRKAKWDKGANVEKYYGTLWAHVAKIFSLFPHGLKVKYLQQSLLLKRGDNDSFLDKGIVNRIAVTIDGYQRLSNDFFGEKSFEAFHVRRVLRKELTLKFLYANKLKIAGKEDENKLNGLVKRLYKDRLIANRINYFFYKNTPLSFIFMMRLVYKFLKKSFCVNFLKKTYRAVFQQ